MSITPDWDAWNALPPEEQARRLAARLRADGRDVTVVDARQRDAGVTGDRAGRREPARPQRGGPDLSHFALTRLLTSPHYPVDVPVEPARSTRGRTR